MEKKTGIIIIPPPIPKSPAKIPEKIPSKKNKKSSNTKETPLSLIARIIRTRK
jgi:hypothetical protein